MLDRIRNKLQLSQACWIACAFAGLLLALTLVAWTCYQFDPQRVAWGDYMTVQRGLSLLAIFIVTTLAVYWTARLWLEELPAEADELHAAWLAGTSALDKLGLKLGDLPLFLMLGSCDAAEQTRLMQCGHRKLLFAGLATRATPINWFVSEDAIFVFCATPGVLGRTVERLKTVGADGYRVDSELDAMFDGDREHLVAQTVDMDAAERTQAASLAASPTTESTSANPSATASHTSATSPPLVREREGSIRQQHSGSATAVASAPQTIPATESSNIDARTTRSMEELDFLLQAELDEDLNATSGGVFVGAEELLSSSDIIEGQRGLFDTSVYLKQARRPAAPINGIGIVIDVRTATASVLAAQQCGQAIRRDLRQLRMTLGVDAPVTLMLNRLEEVPGASELIRRLGPARAAAMPLGVQCDPRTVLDLPTLSAVSAAATCGIQRQVYQLLRASNALTLPGNQRLVNFLIQCRGRWSQCLPVLLREALADRTQRATQPAFFSGAFFCAAGDKPTRKGFCAGVMKRIRKQQQLIAWTLAEQRLHAWTRRATLAMLSGCAAASIALAYQILL